LIGFERNLGKKFHKTFRHSTKIGACFLNNNFSCYFMNNIFLEEKAQISVELIIVLAAVVAVVLVLVSQLQDTSTTGSEKLEKTAEEVFKKIDNI
jgi:hypothetical protein